VVATCSRSPGRSGPATQVPQIRSPPLFEKLRDHSSDDPAFFFEHLCRAVFQADISGRIVTARWDGIRAASGGSDPAKIASSQPADTARLEAGPRVIRNSARIEATAKNAPGTPSHPAPARHHPEVPRIIHPNARSTASDLHRRFRFPRHTGARRLLASAAQDAG